jgi:hypothetical protein
MATLASEIQSSAPGPTPAAPTSTSRARSATRISRPPGAPSVFTRASPDRSVLAVITPIPAARKDWGASKIEYRLAGQWQAV